MLIAKLQNKKKNILTRGSYYKIEALSNAYIVVFGIVMLSL